MLLANVNHEECRGKTVEVGNRAEVFLELGALTGYLEFLALRQIVESAVLGHLVDGGHLLHGLADGGEVGEHAAGPALDYVRHAYALSLCGEDLLGLLLGGHEEDFLAALGKAAEHVGCVFEFCGSLIEVDDVDTVALHEDVRSHCRIPFSFHVAKMATCFEELVKIWS